MSSGSLRVLACIRKSLEWGITGIPDHTAGPGGILLLTPDFAVI